VKTNVISYNKTNHISFWRVKNLRITQMSGIYQLAFMPRMFPVNCYLVEEEAELTLIDAGVPFSVKGILGTASSLRKPITRIVLTHAHSDHIGALDRLKQSLPEARVYISRRDARLLAGDRALEPGEPDCPVKGGVPKPEQIKTKPDILLEEGERVGSLLALAAAGHTPGSMAFLDTRSRVLVAGDAFQIRGGMAVSGQLKLGFPFPALATWSKERALASAIRLLEHKPSCLAVGHGPMLPQPVEAMKQAIESARRNLQAAGLVEGGR
jgi:glyoxylase-like metal-dependent hydrolase (beta-lactamase superfamily II)